MRIGVDAGGTFTDFVILHDDGRLESFKLRSNPASPDAVILEGIRRGSKGSRAEVVHGSTVATNALLERKGARTAFVTTDGFTDLVSIGRQNRPQLYNLTPTLRRPLIPPALCFGVKERTYFDGKAGSKPAAAELRVSKASSAPRASNQWRSAFCTPIRIRRTNKLPPPRLKVTCTFRSRTKWFRSIANTSAPRPRSSTPTSDR